VLTSPPRRPTSRAKYGYRAKPTARHDFDGQDRRTIVAADTDSRAAPSASTQRSRQARRDGADRPGERGTAIRDALDFGLFNDFTNQIDSPASASRSTSTSTATAREAATRRSDRRKITLTGAFALDAPERRRC